MSIQPRHSPTRPLDLGHLTYRQQLILGSTTTSLILAIGSYGLRLYVKRKIVARIWWDDYTIGVGLVCRAFQSQHSMLEVVRTEGISRSAGADSKLLRRLLQFPVLATMSVSGSTTYHLLFTLMQSFRSHIWIRTTCRHPSGRMPSQVLSSMPGISTYDRIAPR